MSPQAARATTAVPIGEPLSRVLDLVVESGHSLLLTGATGIGKSTFVLDEARRRGLDAVVLNLSLYESPGELLGLPYADGGVTRYARPSVLPTEGRGFLVLEELSRVSRYMLAPLYELLTARTIGEYVLPAGWIVVANANPAGPDYHTSELDLAMRDRFLCIEVCVDREEWCRWAAANGVHPAILALARQEPQAFRLVSPRRWASLSAELSCAERLGLDRRALESVLAARLGSVGGAQALAKYLGDGFAERPYGPLEIVSRYARDGQLAQLVREEKREGRTDLLETLTLGVEELLCGDRLAALVADGSFDLESFEGFLGDLPGDRRRALQDAFSASPASARTLDVAPEQVLAGYRGSPLSHEVDCWLRGDAHHRVGALMQRLREHVEELAARGLVGRALRSRKVRASLAHFVEHVGAERLGPFGAALDAHGFVFRGEP